nr:MAG TPA: hypothetical protein [Caudoviricetes sp.]
MNSLFQPEVLQNHLEYGREFAGRYFTEGEIRSRTC